MATISGLTIEIGADTKKFQKEINKMSKDIKDTEKQVNSLEKSLEIEFDSTRFGEAQRLAQDAIEKTEQKAKALREELKYLEETGVDKTSQKYKDFESQLVQTEAKVVSLRDKLRSLNEVKINNLVNNINNVGNAVSSLGSAIMPASIAAGALVAGVTKIGTSSIKTADDIATLATQIGLSAEELQRWQYIAMQTDVSDSDLQTGLTKIQKSLGELATGELSTTSKVLQDLGISAEDASKGMEANFSKIIDILSGIEDPILRANYANELFGSKLGSKIIPLLKAGGEGLKKLSDEFDSLGFLTNEQVKQFSDFDNVMNKIKYQFENIKNQLGYALLPVMQSVTSLIENKVIPTIKKLSDWIGNLDQGQVELILKIASVVAAIGPLLVLIGKLTTGVGSLIKSLASLGPTLSALESHPIIAIIGVIAILLTILYTKNEEFRKSVDKLLGILNRSAMPIINTLSKALKDIVLMLEGIVEVLGDDLADAIQFICVLLEPVVFVLEYINKLISMINDGILALVGKGWIWNTEDDMDQDVLSYGESSYQIPDYDYSTINNSSNNTSNSVVNTTDNSVTNNYITIEANEYTSAEEVARQLSLKLQSRS